MRKHGELAVDLMTEDQLVCTMYVLVLRLNPRSPTPYTGREARGGWNRLDDVARELLRRSRQQRLF